VIKALSYQQRKIGFVDEKKLDVIEIKEAAPYEMAYISYRDPAHYHRGVSFAEPKSALEMLVSLKWARQYKLDFIHLFVKRLIWDLTRRDSDTNAISALSSCHLYKEGFLGKAREF
jgi:hypothetical protein